jgi:stalled ribosome rescue protein Dom34
MLTPRKSYQRGYPVAILAGLEEDHATLWKVFSKVVKPARTIQLEGPRSNPKPVYNFHEAIINAVKPTLKEGVKSIIIASPPRTNYAQELINHVNKHHHWLTQGVNKTAFAEISGSATTKPQVAALTSSLTFQRLIKETTSEETTDLLDLLEKRLNTSDMENAVLYSLEEAETLVIYSPKTSRRKPEFLILTVKYLTESRHKNRLNRLMQIVSNKNIKTRIVNAESQAGKRLTQLGGFVCLTQPK